MKKVKENIWIATEMLFLSVFLLNCSREEAVPVIADFEHTVVKEDYSVPVQIVLSNRTEGADRYEWDFTGGTPDNSNQRNPGTVTYSKKGMYKITLTATNRDGSKSEKSRTLNLDGIIDIGFTAAIRENPFSPVVVAIENSSEGATSYDWVFEGGTPFSSEEENPGDVIFTQPGDHKISLRISNGRETYTKDTLIKVAPFLIPNFDFELDFQDKDLQVPVVLTLKNKSVSATGFSWEMEGASPRISNDEGPQIRFDTPGTKKITLTAFNGKDTKTITKELTLLPDTNIKVLTDIKFGINTSHTRDSIGAFFSATKEKVYNRFELSTIESSLIDLVFYGQNETFSFNRFYPPNNLESTTFERLPGAKPAMVMNAPGKCNCGTSLSAEQFDGIKTDALLKGLNMVQNNTTFQPFDNSKIPHIVLFETYDGRKGAIKIKSFVKDGDYSYIVADIKIQKLNSN